MSGARREIETERVQAYTAPLELRAPGDRPPASIGADGSVTIGGAPPLPLDTRQREASLAYREASLEVVDLSLQAASG